MNKIGVKEALKSLILGFVLLVLLASDLQIIWSIVNNIFPGEGFIHAAATVATAALILAPVTIIPVFVLNPLLINYFVDKRFKQWTGQEDVKLNAIYVTVLIVLFVLFAILVIVLSIYTRTRFIPEASGAGRNFATTIPLPDNINITMAAWFTGVLPFITTVVSFLVHYAMENVSKTSSFQKQIDINASKKEELKSKIINKNKELILLENLDACISHIKRRINNYANQSKSIKEQYIKNQKDEMNDANHAIKSQCRIHFNNSYRSEIIQFNQVIEGDKDAGEQLYGDWEKLYKEQKLKLKNIL